MNVIIRGLIGIQVHRQDDDRIHSLQAVVAVTSDNGVSHGYPVFWEPIVPAEESQTYAAIWENNCGNRQGVEFKATLPILTDENPSQQEFKSEDCSLWSALHNYNITVGIAEQEDRIHPIAIASLPIAAPATQLAGQKKSILLDLPVYNVTSLSLNPFCRKSKAPTEESISMKGTAETMYSIVENLATLRLELNLFELKRTKSFDVKSSCSPKNSFLSKINKVDSK